MGRVKLCLEGQVTMGLMRKTLIAFCLGSLSCCESFSTTGLGGTGLRQCSGRGGGVAASQGGRATGWVVPHCSTLSGHAAGHCTLSGGLGDLSLSRPVLGLESRVAGRGARALCRMCANDEKTGDDDVPSFLSGVLPAARQPLRGNGKVGEVGEEEVEKEGVGEPWPHGEGGKVEPREVFPKDPPAMDAAPAEATKSQYPSPMWDTWSEEEVMRSLPFAHIARVRIRGSTSRRLYLTAGLAVHYRYDKHVDATSFADD